MFSGVDRTMRNSVEVLLPTLDDIGRFEARDCTIAVLSCRSTSIFDRRVRIERWFVDGVNDERMPRLSSREWINKMQRRAKGRIDAIGLEERWDPLSRPSGEREPAKQRPTD
jgi:hypothetical protein